MNRRCNDRVAVIAAMSPLDVRVSWERERAKPAPAISPSLLARDLAHELQVSAHGGLDRRLARHLDRLCEAEKAESVAAIIYPPSSPAVGSTLLREWNGKVHKVTVAGDRDYCYDGQSYRSLSVIARTITGTRWSGPRFFGLPR